MSKLEFIQNKTDEKTLIVLKGQIDESFPEELCKLQTEKNIIIDLDQIKMINSLGIREWIKFMNSFSSKEIAFINTPKIFIDQINMVQGFITPNCSVQSFYVPYFNEDTNSEKNILYSFGKEYGVDYINIVPSIKDDDGVELELDVVEQKYFKFLKNQNK